MLKKIFCLAIMLCLFTACNEEVQSQTSETSQSTTSEQTQTTSTRYGLWVDGVWYDCDPVIAVGEYEMDMAMYRYYFFKAKSEFEQDYGNTIWGNTQANEDLKEYVLNNYLNIIAYYELAKQNDIELSQEDLTNITNIVNAVKANYADEESFEEALSAQYLNEEIYAKLIEIQLLQEKVISNLYGEDIVATVDETFVYVQQIYIDATVENAQEQIEEALQKLDEGAEFEDIMLEYSNVELGGQTGYIYSSGMMQADLESVAFELEKGEYSDVIYSETYGYYIIKRLEIETEYVWQNITNMVSDTMYDKISADLDAIINELEVSVNKNYTKISTDTLY